MSGQNSASICRVNPYQYLQIVVNPDGTITRDPNRYSNSSPSVDSTPVLSQDISINQSKNTWIRVFLPDSSFTCSKLPLIVYFHGGGFINCSAASTIFHDFCSNMAVDIPAIVVSSNYRLAPENRLPAAYDDAEEVFQWIKNSQLDWLREHADYNRCFIMGSSAGANIAYHAGFRVGGEVGSLEPLKIKGLILHHPFIGGTQRTESELRLVNDLHLPLSVSDLMWDLSLPIGVDRDHEYCNPTANGGSKLWENMRLLGWRVLVTGCDGDPTIDRQMELVEMLRATNVGIASHFSEGGYHVVELKEPSKFKTLVLVLKEFMFSSADD
ncbi:hypothetical protein P3X46_030643 [Hevea brasiliensis]|uniref:Alpha/beta hydrolase fold-3 domain-containing protein n=1 Tax=Hevea brasiliensis TaxID=3981 RepID=A0ABQ9KJQ3_HEVBR|nr:carboxylesterase 1 [Hevea brasiliensis]XP_057998330.1 carboxylesterase 1-like [Hevea brasiliensis]KAJ9128660.1 hypothetical protein P3X46_034644 [Hevea brasiliensis]KAJ9139952.1 hypothetical protein P3X46_030643 [Hevea brasiliensis]